jgi:hypothetical protein
MIGSTQYYSTTCPVGKGQLKDRSRLKLRTNLFSFKKLAETECRLDLRIYCMYISKMGACSSIVVKALCYKPEGRGFKTR